MAYNFFPQPNYQPPQQTGINWVQGIGGAKAWMVAPGQTAFLMDSEGQTFYIKSADQTGMPTLKVYDFKERLPDLTNGDQGEWEKLSKRIDDIEARLSRLGAAVNE